MYVTYYQTAHIPLRICEPHNVHRVYYLSFAKLLECNQIHRNMPPAATAIDVGSEQSENSPLLPDLAQKRREDGRSESYGYALMLLSAIFFEVSGMVARAVTVYHGVTVPNVVFLRGVTQISLGVFTSFVFANPKEVFTVPRNLLHILALRGLFGASSMALTYTALSLVPLGVCTSLFFLNPIFTIILSSATIGEKVSRRELLAVASTIIGVVLIANPTLEAPGQLSASYVLGVCIVLTSSVVVSVAFVTVRAMGKRVHFLANVMVFGCGTMSIGLCIGGAALPGFTKGVALTLGGCVFGFFGQCFLNLGFQYCRASTGSLLRTVDVPLAYLLGVIFLGEVPHFVSLVGSTIVIGGNIVVALGAVQTAGKKQGKEVGQRTDID